MKKSHLLTTTAICLLAVMAFDNTVKAGWKLDADGKIEMKDGNPIYINTAGQDMTVGADKISQLNAESKGHRERAEAAEQKLKAFDGIDVVAAKKAIETVSKLDAKTLIDAGEVDKVKDDIKNSFTTQLNEKDKVNSDLQSKYDNLLINGVFSNSQFVRDSIAVPQDMFEASFRNNFKIGKDGAVEAYDKAGNRIMSREKIGENATPEEALKIIVESHPQKDTILKASGASGSGSQGNGGGNGGSRTIKRSEFDKMTPVKQAETSQAMAKGEMKIVD